jgi:hypothetical protein
LFKTLGQFPARAREVAGIAERVALEIVLVLRLGLPEFAGGRDLRHDAAWPQAGRVDIIDCPECLVTLRTRKRPMVVEGLIGRS